MAPTFNIFGPTTKCDIRVGYISTTRGYIPDLTRHQANEHAKLDPGTTFIFKTRDVIKYLNINEVNALEPKDLLPKSMGETCEGPTLNVPQDQVKPPRVVFTGGGGVGAQANPVFGLDGSLLAVDVVNGGLGYSRPPHVEIRDDLNLFAGSRLRSILCEKPIEYIYYDQEDDYEEYDLTTCGIPDLNNYGVRYGPNAEVIGIWDPTAYANLSKDPIRAEIFEYQQYLARGLNPWWTTRKNVPLSITAGSDGQTKRTKWDVKHWYWGGSRTGGVTSGGVTTGGEPLAFVEVPFLVYTEGGHGRGLLFQFTSEDGSHKFKIKADDYKDGASAKEVRHKIKPNMVYNVVSAGSNAKGRGTEQGLITPGSFGRRGKEQDDAGGGPEGNTIFADMVTTRDDDDDLQVQAKLGVFKQGNKGRSSDNNHDTFALTYILQDSSAFTPVTTTPVTTTPVNITVGEGFMNTHAISPVPPSNVPGSDYAGIVYTFIWEEDFPYEGEYIFRGMRDNEAKLFIDNVYVPNVTNPSNSSSLTNFDAGSGIMGSGGTPAKIKKMMTAGVHQIKVDLLNIPVKENRVVPHAGGNDVTFKITSSAQFANGIVIPGLGIDVKKTFDGPQINRSFTKTPERGRMYDVILSSDETKHGIRLRTRGENVLQMEEHDDDDWRDIVCTASQGRFVNLSGNRCKFILDKSPASTLASPGSTVSEGIGVKPVFNTVDWINRSNRQLWRTNVYGRGGFLNEYGVCPFDTMNLLPDNPYAGSHRIVWGNLDFPEDGNYSIEVEVDDNVNLTFQKDKIDVVRIRKEGFVDNNSTRPTGKSTYVRAFKRGKHKLIADLEQIPGGVFGFGPGITGGTASNSNIQARFISRGSDFYLDVRGNGSATISFVMESDDRWGTAGVAAKEIRIKSDQDTIKLKRTPNEERETKRGSGLFTAGNQYKVSVIGAVSGAGQSRVADRSIQLLVADGNDTNVELILNQITNKISSSIKGINPMSLAVNVKAAYTIEEVISPKSWQENPMGLAMTIEAPMPPIPQEPVETGEGRCPRNPTWTTRFPGAQTQWWPVGGDPRWSKFMNRYAISPVPPLADLNTERSDEWFSNTWPLQIDYDGYYGVKGTRDNKGKILIDGDVVSELDGFKTEDPSTVKKYLKAGDHSVTVQVYNERRHVPVFIDEKVFNTADWAVKQTSKAVTTQSTVPGGSTSHPIIYKELNSSNKKIRVVDNNKKIELKDGKGDDANVEFIIKSGNAKFSDDGKSIEGNGKVTIEIDYDDNPNYKGEAVRSITIKGVTWHKKKEHHGGETHIVDLGSTPTTTSTTQQVNEGGLVSGIAKDGVTYEGPPLASYRVEALGPSLTPAWTTDQDFRDNFMGRAWTSVWRGVNFPSDNQYTLKALADDGLRVYIDDVEIGNPPDFAAEVYEGVREYNFNVSKGKHDIRMEYYNIPGNNKSTFWTNPVAFSVIITVKKKVLSGDTHSWRTNPVAISAKIYPPPCPRVIGGKGVVCDVEIDPPGNGPPRETIPEPGITTSYPVRVDLTEIRGEGGIGYNCEVDEVVIEPSNGAVAKPICGAFGRIERIEVISPGIGFTGTPTIRIDSPTGSGPPPLVPVMTPVRDPLDIPPDKLIQVTDLVGLKQTGYYDGRPYYGAVFYKDGIRYAGYYETAGQLIQIYDTLQESIDARVTTPPSAIQRQGTDITSNDPRLDIPNTPDNLI